LVVDILTVASEFTQKCSNPWIGDIYRIYGQNFTAAMYICILSSGSLLDDITISREHLHCLAIICVQILHKPKTRWLFVLTVNTGIYDLVDFFAAVEMGTETLANNFIYAAAAPSITRLEVS